MIDDVVMKGKSLIIPCLFQKHILDQPHSNNMYIEKSCMLSSESMYWINMSVDTEKTLKECSTCPEY